MYDIMINNATILTLDNNMNIIENGSIGIRDGVIEYTGNSLNGQNAERIIDAAGNIVMPGLINCHTHSAMSIYRGLADDTPLFEWLQNHIWPVENEFVTPENVKLASELSAAEMIRSGTTAFNDMYFYSPQTAEIVKRTGLRAVMGEAVIDDPVSIYKISKNYYKEFFDDIAYRDRIIPSLVPHSPYTCTEALLKEIAGISEDKNINKHIHISETVKENNIIFERTGKSPVEYLKDIGFLDSRTVAVHCVELSDRDIDILASENVGIVHCPQSNLKLGSGIAPVKKMLQAGLTVSLGTDGPASNNTLDMFSEMKTAALIHKGIHKDASLLNSKEIVRMATINGAEVLGIDKFTGTVEKGKKADIIILDMNSLHLKPVYDPYSHIVYSAKGSDVDTVIVDGRILMDGKKLITVNEASLIKNIEMISCKIKDFKRSQGG